MFKRLYSLAHLFTAYDIGHVTSYFPPRVEFPLYLRVILSLLKTSIEKTVPYRASNLTWV